MLAVLDVASNHNPLMTSPKTGIVIEVSVELIVLINLGACEKFVCRANFIRKKECPSSLVRYRS
jgi:hypothetical protein